MGLPARVLRGRSPYPNETNPIEPGYHEAFHNAPAIDWSAPQLDRITRLRLLTDPGFPWWDVSYCHGVLKDGTRVRVLLPFSQLGRRTWWTEIRRYAERDGVNIVQLHVWESMSKLW